MIDLPDFPVFEWPLQDMYFYSSLGMNQSYLICARDPGDKYQYGSVVWKKEFGTQKERDAYLARVHRLQILTAGLMQ